MQQSVLFLSQKQNRGGAIYEEQVRKVLEPRVHLDILELNARKNKILVFTKLKYFYQIRSYKPVKKFSSLITNKAGVYAGILGRKANKKILILHHYDSEENVHAFLNPLLKNRLLSSLKKFDLIIVVSTYWKNFFSSYVSTEKIQVIYNSFDVDKINNIISNFNKTEFIKKYNIPENKIVVYAGNALKIKGYDEVIKQLTDEKYFVITSGNKDEDAALENLHLTLNYTEYIQLLCCVDVTVIFSKFQEGWNRIAHESLLCKTPVIGRDVAGMGELLHNAKQTVIKDGDNLPQLIEAALNNKEAILHGWKYASQYNLEYFKNKWLSVLL